jgi:hypothetical protein
VENIFKNVCGFEGCLKATGLVSFYFGLFNPKNTMPENPISLKSKIPG